MSMASLWSNGSILVEPGLVRVVRVGPAEERGHQLGRRSRAAGTEHSGPVAGRRPLVEQALAGEHGEQVLGDDERPHVRAVERGVPGEVAENGDEVSVLAGFE